MIDFLNKIKKGSILESPKWLQIIQIISCVWIIYMLYFILNR
jgi:hypothetical protein